MSEKMTLDQFVDPDWKSSVSFYVPGEIQPQPRPRFDWKTRRVCKNTAIRRADSFKNKIALFSKTASLPYQANEQEFSSNSWMATIGFVFARPKTHYLASKKLSTKAPLRPNHSKVGDLDNLAKSVLDALTGLFWKDDGQVFVLRVVKVYETAEFRAGTHVLLREIVELTQHKTKCNVTPNVGILL